MWDADNEPVADLLADLARRPEPFARYTTPEFWNDPHVSVEMLKWHLNPQSDRASYRPDTIREAVAWLDKTLNLAGKRVCDLGCGPGLYTQAMHDRGAAVIGIDVSENSLSYAKTQARAEARQAGRRIDYRRLNYVEDELPDGMDLFTLISRDFCVLSPEQRQLLLGRVRAALRPGGHLIFDVEGEAAFDEFEETALIEPDLMAGFWAESPYLGLKKSFSYPDRRVTLERYLILKPPRSAQVFNWLQYFSPDEIDKELSAAGFNGLRRYGGFDGSRCEARPPYFVVIAD